MPTEPAATVVLPSHQRRQSVTATVRALLAQDVDEPFEVVVVDDGSTDGTSDVLSRIAAEDDRLRPLRLPRNRGPGHARNVGWRAARGAVVAFTDDDCVPQPGWLRALLAATSSGADLVMGRTVQDPDALARGGPFSHFVRVEDPMPWFPTCNIAYRRRLLVELDGFDETFTDRIRLNFGDDTDLAWRALERGADARFAPEAVVVHDVTPSDWPAWVRARRRRAGVPEVLARHPGLRAQLPRRWAYSRGHPLALGAAAGLALAATRPRSARAWIAAAVLCRPYVQFRVRGEGRRPVPGSGSPAAVAGLLVADLVETGVVAWHAARRGIAVL